MDGKTRKNVKNKNTIENKRQELTSELSVKLSQNQKNYSEIDSVKCSYKKTNHKIIKLCENPQGKKTKNTWKDKILRNEIKSKDKKKCERKNTTKVIRKNKSEKETVREKNEIKRETNEKKRTKLESETNRKLKLKKEIQEETERKNQKEKMFGLKAPTEEKMIFMEMTSGEKSFEKVSLFFIKKNIDALCGEVLMAKKIRDGRLLIKTKNTQQALKLINETKLGNHAVESKYNEKGNQSTGVVFNRDLKYSTDEEIIDNLKSQGVIAVRRCTKKDQAQVSYDTGLFFFTFNTPNIPEEIKIGYEIVEVRQYIPEPLRCFTCLKFGHTKHMCPTKTEKCGNCYENTHTDRTKKEICLKKKKCGNCGEKTHGSFDKKCLKYLQEKEIVLIKTTKRVTHGMARSIFFKANPLGKRAYAAMVTSNNDGKSAKDGVKDPKQKPPPQGTMSTTMQRLKNICDAPSEEEDGDIVMESQENKKPSTSKIK